MWRIESARLIGGLLRVVHDIELAEDHAQEALVIALERWPSLGIPDNPGAWLMTVAKKRAVDHLRREEMVQRKHRELERAPVEADRATSALTSALDDPVDDDLLRLMFIACHPILSREARAALTLRLLGGLTTAEVARAFLVSESTVAQRIVRAKRTLAQARVPFEVPRGAELSERLGSVLEVLYLIFNEGYVASRGDDWVRPELCNDALRLGRILAELLPMEAELIGLVALMELQASRIRARVDRAGHPVLLLEQDRAQWDRLLIGRGVAALRRAEALAHPLGPYTLQAAIASCHALATTPEETDWIRIVALYDALVERTRSPVVELNRAVAAAMAFGPAVGLELVEALVDERSLKGYYLLPCVRGDLLQKLGRAGEASLEFRRAASMTRNAREQALLLTRAEACESLCHEG